MAAIVHRHARERRSAAPQQEAAPRTGDALTKKDLKQLVARARRVTPPGSPSRAKAAIVPPEAGVTNVGAPGADAVNVETVLSSTGEACTVEPEHAPSSLKGSPEGARAISVTIEGVLEHGGLGLGLDSDNLISEVEPSSVCHPPPEPRMNTFAPSPPRPSHPHARLRSRVQPASAKDVRLVTTSSLHDHGRQRNRSPAKRVHCECVVDSCSC